MRALVMAALALATLAGGCDRIREKVEEKKAETEIALPAPKPAPMTPERLAVCAAALEAWTSAGAGRAPAGVSADDAREAATLLGMRKMEVALTDAAATDAAIAQALTAWKDKTPADIEAGAAVCMKETRG
jgi:hypothetical protein